MESLEHLIRTKLAAQYGAAKDLTTLLCEWIDDARGRDIDTDPWADVSMIGDRDFWDGWTHP